MSASAIPSAPFENKDLRSTSLPSKRDKDHNQKWANGQRPLPGVNFSCTSSDDLDGGSEHQREMVRPKKQWSQTNTDHKSHANIIKPHGHYYETGLARRGHKAEALIYARDPDNSTLSKSLLELLPQHANNIQSPIQTAILSATDAEILYSFDSKGPSPSAGGRKIDLGGLVEQAQQEWSNKQTEKIVKTEYEMLDRDGETMVAKNKKKRGSPKQKATLLKTELSNIKGSDVADDDDFELI